MVRILLILMGLCLFGLGSPVDSPNSFILDRIGFPLGSADMSDPVTVDIFKTGIKDALVSNVADISENTELVVSVLGFYSNSEQIVLYKVEFPGTDALGSLSLSNAVKLYLDGATSIILPSIATGQSKAPFVSTPITAPTVGTLTETTIFDLSDPNIETHVQSCPSSTPRFDFLTTSEFSEDKADPKFVSSFGFKGKSPAFVTTSVGRVSPIIDFSPAKDMNKWFKIPERNSAGAFIDCRAIASSTSNIASYKEAFDAAAVDGNYLVKVETQNTSPPTYTSSVCEVTLDALAVAYRCLKLQSCSSSVPNEIVASVASSGDYAIFSKRSASETRSFDMLPTEDAAFSRGAMVDPFTRLSIPAAGLYQATRKASTGFVAEVDMPRTSRKIRVYKSDLDQVASLNRAYMSDSTDVIPMSVIPLGYSLPFVAEKVHGGDESYILKNPTSTNAMNTVRGSTFSLHRNATGFDPLVPAPFPRFVADSPIGADGTIENQVPLSLMMTDITFLGVAPDTLPVPSAGIWEWTPGGVQAFRIVKESEYSAGGVKKYLAKAKTQANIPWGGCYRIHNDGTVKLAERVQGIGYDETTNDVLCEEGYVHSVVLTVGADKIQAEQAHRAYQSSSRSVSGFHPTTFKNSVEVTQDPACLGEGSTTSLNLKEGNTHSSLFQLNSVKDTFPVIGDTLPLYDLKSQLKAPGITILVSTTNSAGSTVFRLMSESLIIMSIYHDTAKVTLTTQSGVAEVDFTSTDVYIAVSMQDTETGLGITLRVWSESTDVVKEEVIHTGISLESIQSAYAYSDIPGTAGMTLQDLRIYQRHITDEEASFMKSTHLTKDTAARDADNTIRVGTGDFHFTIPSGVLSADGLDATAASITGTSLQVTSSFHASSLLLDSTILGTFNNLRFDKSCGSTDKLCVLPESALTLTGGEYLFPTETEAAVKLGLGEGTYKLSGISSSNPLFIESNSQFVTLSGNYKHTYHKAAALSGGKVTSCVADNAAGGCAAGGSRCGGADKAIMAVTCCDGSGAVVRPSTCSIYQTSGASFTVAQNLCLSSGNRLCTTKELMESTSAGSLECSVALDDKLSWTSDECPSAYSNIATLTVTGNFGFANLGSIDDESKVKDRRLAYTTECRSTPFDDTPSRPSGKILWEDTGSGFQLSSGEGTNYAVVPSATAPINPLGKYTHPMAMDMIPLEQGEIGGDYPIERYCPGAYHDSLVNAECSETATLGQPDIACGGALCGVVPYSVSYSGLSSMIFGDSVDAELSYRKENYFGYPGITPTSSDIPVDEWMTKEVQDEYSVLDEREVMVGVSQALAIEVSGLKYQGGNIQIDGLSDLNRIVPTCEAKAATFARLKARLGTSTTGFVTTSIETNLAPLPFIRSIVVQEPKTLLTNGDLYTYENEVLQKDLTWFGGKSIKVTISTLQVFSNMPPHIPVISSVEMGAEALSNGTATGTICKFKAYFPAGNRVDITDMVTTPSDITANILVNTAELLETIVLQNGQTIVTKEIDGGTPFWTSKTAVNMVPVTAECKDYNEFSKPYFNISHTYHMPVENDYMVYSSSSPLETRVMYISNTTSNLSPLVSLANIDNSGQTPVVNEMQGQIETVMSSREYINIEAGPGLFDIIPKDEKGDADIFLIDTDITLTFPNGNDAVFTQELQDILLEAQREAQGTEKITITKVTLSAASGRRSTGVEMKAEMVIEFAEEATALSSAAGQGSEQVTQTAVSTRLLGTDLESQVSDVTAPPEPATIRRTTTANEVVLSNVEAFPMFNVAAYTDTFVHGFSIDNCLSEIQSIDDLRTHTYNLNVTRTDGYLNEVMSDRFSSRWLPYQSLLTHPSVQSLDNDVSCINPKEITDVYGKSGPSGSFLVTTTETHLFAPLISTWSPFAEVAQVVACLTSRVESTGDFDIAISSASSTSEIQYVDSCSSRERICGANEIQVQLMTGTQRAFEFAHNRMCFDLDPNTTLANVFNLEKHGEVCAKEYYIPPSHTGEVNGTSLNMCQTSEGCLEAVLSAGDNETSSHYRCGSSDIRAFEFKYTDADNNKHFRSDIDTIRDSSGNVLTLSTLRLDLGMFSRIASSVKVHQLLYVGMKNDLGERRSEKIQRITSTGATFSESKSGVPACTQSMIQGSSTPEGAESDVQFYCSSPQCNGVVDVKPPSLYNNFETQITCVPDALSTSSTSSSDTDNEKDIMWTIVMIAGGLLVVAAVVAAFYFMYWKKREVSASSSAISNTKSVEIQI